LTPPRRTRAPSDRSVDRRGVAFAAALAAIIAGGTLVHFTQSEGDATLTRPRFDTRAHAASARDRELHARFAQSVAMLHAKQFDHAVTALHRVLELDPRMPEAHVNMGYALLGLQRPQPARDFFESATTLRPGQANAYYGLAVALDALGDRDAALGAMRTYVHLSTPDDPFRRKGEAAVWEWSAARDASRRTATAVASRQAAPAPAQRP